MYRGFKVYNCGYHHPDHRVVWEASDESTGEAVAHGWSKSEVLQRIDDFMDKEEYVINE